MTDVKRIKSRRLHTALNGRVSWYCIPEHDHADYEAAVEALERILDVICVNDPGCPQDDHRAARAALARLRADQSS